MIRAKKAEILIIYSTNELSEDIELSRSNFAKLGKTFKNVKNFEVLRIYQQSPFPEEKAKNKKVNEECTCMSPYFYEKILHASLKTAKTFTRR